MVGSQDNHPSVNKFLLLRANVYKLTGNDIPHPFLTCSLFLCCDICVKNIYTFKKITASKWESTSLCTVVNPLSPLPPQLVENQSVTTEFRGLRSCFVVNGSSEGKAYGKPLGLYGFIALVCMRSHWCCE